MRLLNMSIDEAAKYTAEVYQRVIGITPLGAWAPHRLDKFYYPLEVAGDPLRQSGIILAWYDTMTSESGKIISIAWIYAMVVRKISIYPKRPCYTFTLIRTSWAEQQYRVMHVPVEDAMFLKQGFFVAIAGHLGGQVAMVEFHSSFCPDI
ncbi:hypothetical protein P691DRAFT_566276 [Macrolepiota fuliginosa MF-IS2]|uniref:Uncharacterized protein n=1 Tax=Macrolepiota fuliginosa MF-IS2 TaxID=1400762 RepID=A0A9P5XFU7_9AGAR|nr:hypothetical protein P691DRAFT_566276 [Macrolepiota fuliginosa MF-IS2]